MQHRRAIGLSKDVTVKSGVLRGCKATGRGGNMRERTLETKVGVGLCAMKVCE